MKTYDYVVVGAGMFGATFAQQAIEAGRSVLVLESRDHIAGNCHTTVDERTNVVVHEYGTHAFHTSSSSIWAYVNRFGAFNSYRHRVFARHNDRTYPLPVNLLTLELFFGRSFSPREAAQFFASNRVRYPSPANFAEQVISVVGLPLYEAFFEGYTRKHWGCDPSLLPASVARRLPVRSNFNSDYFDDAFQGVPTEGYTPLIGRMLEGCDVRLSTDFFADRAKWEAHALRRVIFTGAIDRYFGFSEGPLAWRSVTHKKAHYKFTDDALGCAQLNFVDESFSWTRAHEPKHLTPERRSAGSVVLWESSSHDGLPAYPVNSPSDSAKLNAYRRMQSEVPHVRFGGRLAEYRYYDMHQAIAAALKMAREELSS